MARLRRFAEAVGQASIVLRHRPCPVGVAKPARLVSKDTWPGKKAPTVVGVLAAHLPDMTANATIIEPAAAAETGPRQPLSATPGARLAAVSRAAQGFGATVGDPAVLARLAVLCAAPRPPSRPATRPR